MSSVSAPAPIPRLMLRNRLSDARGFMLIEAVAAAALLAIVALGVLGGLDSAQRSSGREKARSVAAALTEQDQERLRSFRAVDLANYDESRNIEIEINKIKYKITSRVDWVRDSTGGTESCNSSTTEADYMRITSTTESELINTPIPPVKMSSLVAPPVGAFGTNQGTLGVQVNNAAGAGVAGMPVTISGPTTVTNDTNSAGCAIFAYVPIGNYTARVNSVGWVDKGGNQNSSVGATVSQGTVNVKTMVYDQAASVDVSFDTETLGGTTVPATTTQLSATNGGVPSGPFSPFAGQRVYDPAGGAVGTITASGLFPFTDGYALYGGGCPGADPTDNDPDYYTVYPAGYVAVAPGVASPATKVRLPSINLRVLYNGAVLSAANLATTKIVVYSKSTNCTEKFTFNAPAIDTNGWMLEPALPFGTYTVCAESLTPASTFTKRNKLITNVTNWYHRGMKPPDVASPVIDLNSGASAGNCPNTA
jgi:type II secretory pathway pseudopilin PulG